MKRTLLTLAVTSLMAITAFADPIHEAAHDGDLAGVQAELDKGVDVNAKDDWRWKDWGFTPLHFAAYGDHKEIAELLVSAGADMNAKDVGELTPLHWVAMEGYNETTEILIAKGADVNAKTGDGYTPLHSAANNGHKKIAELLIAGGADVNAKADGVGTPLHSAAISAHKEIVELLIAKGADVNANDGYGYTPLDLTGIGYEGAPPEIQSRQKETATLLREHGGEHGTIHGAVSGGDVVAVKEFLTAGVDVDAKGETGRTPLHQAAWKGHKEIAELLIANGAGVNAKDGWSEQTPLHYAARWGHKEIAELLIQNGADVNVKDDWSEQTPLHKAARWGHKEVAELLIAEGADVNAKDYEPFSDKENTPLDWATHPDNPDASAELADLLRKHGGQKLSEFMILHSPLLRSFDKRFSFSFDTKEGKVYEVQDSLNLVNWKAIKTYNGTGRLKWFHAETDHGSPKNFYRVNVVE